MLYPMTLLQWLLLLLPFSTASARHICLVNVKSNIGLDSWQNIYTQFYLKPNDLRESDWLIVRNLIMKQSATNIGTVCSDIDHWKGSVDVIEVVTVFTYLRHHYLAGWDRFHHFSNHKRSPSQTVDWHSRTHSVAD